LYELPELSHLINLENFWCHQNNLTKIPDISNLKKLSILSISHNKLTELQDLSNFKELSMLRCDKNLFTILPISIIQCKKLLYYKKYNLYKSLNMLSYLLNINIKYYYNFTILTYYKNNYIYKYN